MPSLFRGIGRGSAADDAAQWDAAAARAGIPSSSGPPATVRAPLRFQGVGRGVAYRAKIQRSWDDAAASAGLQLAMPAGAPATAAAPFPGPRREGPAPTAAASQSWDDAATRAGIGPGLPSGAAKPPTLIAASTRRG